MSILNFVMLIFSFSIHKFFFYVILKKLKFAIMQYYKNYEIKYLNFMLKQSLKHFFIKQFINILYVVKSRA